MKLSTMIKTQNIGSVCDIRIGLYAKPEPIGIAAYLQARQFSDDGRLVIQADEYIMINKKSASHVLIDGDVLFVGKGSRLFAWCYHETNRPAVASSTFFVLSPNKEVVDPDYLAAFLNSPQSRAAFMQIGGGTNILSIRTSELGAFQIPLPSMEQQKQIAAIAMLHHREIELTQQLLTQKQNMYKAIISKLIK